MASESLSIKELAKLTGAEQSEVTVALQKIDEEFAHRGVVLREIAGGYRFASAPGAREAVEAYLMPPKTNLSPAALETLAIVAYMQPATKGEIEGIRGVCADSVIATLVDRRFLAESGRKDVPGRPMLYKTTAEFLEAFGLRSLEELPPIDVDGPAPVELALGRSRRRCRTTPRRLRARRGAAATSGRRCAGPTGDRRREESEPGRKEAASTPVETTVAEPETEPQPSAV